MALLRFNKLGSNGQVSMEYLFVVGFSILMITPMLLLFAESQSNLRQDVSFAQAEKAANTILRTAERVYYAGYPAQTKVVVFFPENTKGIVLNNSTIIVSLVINDVEDFFFDSDYPLNLSGTIKQGPGVHPLIIKAEPWGVVVNETTV